VDGNPATTWKNAKNTGEPVNAYFRLDPASFPELKDPATALLRVHIRFGVAGGMARFAVCTTADEGPWTPTMLPDPVRAQLAIAPQERSPEVVQQIRTFYADSVDAGGLRLSRELRSLEESKPALEPLMAAVLEVAKRETRIHLRGDFLQKGDSVSPGVFGFLPALQPRGEHPDRLDLAHWLMDPANPLTARVTVNHFWKQLFGRGLVSTENDFGTRGERPSHPELLDWLALEFQRLGWSRKALLKTILLSHTYRQSSQDRSDVREVDPLNILLARQNRLRLEAEVVRDVSLAASGLLNPKIGGPSIKPPLPPDLAALNYAGGLRWEASKGAEVYRRGLYIHFQRTVPYPMLMTFDAPESSVTCTRRDRSNTPLQALTLLNNALFVEAARALGNALLTDGHSPEERVQLGFLRVVGRPPTAEEITRLRDFLAAQTRFFEQHPDQARALFPGDSSPVPPNKEKAANLPIQSGPVHESAALVTLSRVLLNLDETITRD
jgi:hypothetical protein